VGSMARAKRKAELVSQMPELVRQTRWNSRPRLRRCRSVRRRDVTDRNRGVKPWRVALVVVAVVAHGVSDGNLRVRVIGRAHGRDASSCPRPGVPLGSSRRTGARRGHHRRAFGRGTSCDVHHADAAEVGPQRIGKGAVLSVKRVPLPLAPQCRRLPCPIPLAQDAHPRGWRGRSVPCRSTGGAPPRWNSRSCRRC